MDIPSGEISELIVQAIKELNLGLPDDKKLKEDATAVIFGAEGGLDSIDFVSLMVIIEEKVLTKFDKAVTIASEKAFSLKYNPFANVPRLTEFLAVLLKETSV